MPRIKKTPVVENMQTEIESEDVKEVNEVKEVLPKNKISEESETSIKPIENENVKIEKFPPGGDGERFYKYFASRPRRTTFIPLNVGEKFGSEHAVLHIQINDLKLKVRKGVPVELPDELADEAENSVMSQNKAMYEAKLAKTFSGSMGGSIGGSGNTSALIGQQGENSKSVLGV